MKKSLLTGNGILVAAVIVSVYLLGLHHGRTGEGLAIARADAAQVMITNALRNELLSNRIGDPWEGRTPYQINPGLQAMVSKIKQATGQPTANQLGVPAAAAQTYNYGNFLYGLDLMQYAK
jgi:hypothetical protein